MFINEIFDGTNWTTASSHTQEIDRDAQYDRLVAAGTDPVTLRKSETKE